MFAEVPVYIYVQDVNDCAPEFVQDSYNITVPESTPVGSNILSLIAKDNDTGIVFLTEPIVSRINNMFCSCRN